MANLVGKNQTKSENKRMKQKKRAERSNQPNKAKKAVSGVQSGHPKPVEYVVYLGKEYRVHRNDGNSDSVFLEDVAGNMLPISWDGYQKAKENSIQVYAGQYVRQRGERYYRVLARSTGNRIYVVTLDGIYKIPTVVEMETDSFHVVENFHKMVGAAPVMTSDDDISASVNFQEWCVRKNIVPDTLLKNADMVSAYSKVYQSGTKPELKVGDIYEHNGVSYTIQHFQSGYVFMIDEVSGLRGMLGVPYDVCLTFKKIETEKQAETNEANPAPKKTRTIYRSRNKQQLYRLIAVSSDGKTNVYESYLSSHVETAFVGSREIESVEVDESVFQYTVLGQMEDRTVSFIANPGSVQVGDQLERDGYQPESDKMVSILAVDTKDPNATKILSGTVLKKVPLPF